GEGRKIGLIVRCAAIRENKIKGFAYRCKVRFRACQEPHGGQGVERMALWETHRQSIFFAEEAREAIGVEPLRRDFGRAALSPMGEQRPEQNRLRLYLHSRRQLAKPGERYMGERGNDVEIKVDLPHVLLPCRTRHWLTCKPDK